MKWKDAALLALSSLRGSLTKTLLTILGLGVGVGAVLTVLTLGSSGEERVESEIDRLGVDKVWLRAEEVLHPLDDACADCLRQALDVPVCLGAYTAGEVSMNGRRTLTQIAGYDEGLETVHHPWAASGRMLTQRETIRGESVCLMDAALAEKLGGDVLGERVTAGGRSFMVVGVVEGMPAQASAVGSGMLVLPLSAWTVTFGQPASEVTLAVPRGTKANLLADQAVSALAALPGTYGASTLESEIDAARSVVRIFVRVLACVAAVCVVTGGIGVMNVLLISVRERRREIGLIKAVGGTSRQVTALFLLEAAVYALLGGILGVILGIGMVAVFAPMIGLTAEISLKDTLIVLIGAGVLGAVFGVAPAMRASALDPVEALRDG